MMTFCGNPNCDNEATEIVFVSEAKDVVKKRPLCSTCYEAYMSGAQHARLRAVRNLELEIATATAGGGILAASVLFNVLPKVDTCDDPGEADAKYEDDGELHCHECDQEMVVNGDGTTNHLDDEGEIDHDQDADHVALDPREF